MQGDRQTQGMTLEDGKVCGKCINLVRRANGQQVILGTGAGALDQQAAG